MKPARHVKITVGETSYSRTAEDWARLSNAEYEHPRRIEQLERELGRCKPDLWLARARRELASKAVEAEQARTDATGSAKSVMFGQVQAYRDALGLLDTYAAP